MAKKRESPNTLSKRQAIELPGMFVSPDDKIATAHALDAFTGISRSNQAPIYPTYASRTTYKDVETNLSVRNTFRKEDYEYFRPEEALPKSPQEVMQYCHTAYCKVGIIKNIIDLMADFSCQGVRISHPNPRIQKFLNAWGKRIGFCERSCHFLVNFYALGNVAVKRGMMRIPMKLERQFRSEGEDVILRPDMDIPDETKPLRRSIPGRYSFINPTTMEVAGGDLAMFTGEQVYGLKINRSLQQKIEYPRTDLEKELVAKLPADIINAVKSGKDVVPLDPHKVKVYHYKKMDWQEWAFPMTHAILDDLLLLEKMKLADLAALDGAISQIRLWKLGSLEEELFPTDAAINRLSEILLSNPGGGAFDVIWGPTIELVETSTDVHSFLGPEKYQAVLTNIYAGLGVPPTLTGASTASGFTNNFISLQTLIQRLEYGRNMLRHFWENELKIIQQALGFRFKGEIVFDRMTLADESSEKALLLQLVDRNIVSYETVRERFGEIPELERLRVRREEKMRGNEEMLGQLGPYHANRTNEGERLFELLKIALTKGGITPGEAGLTKVLGERRKGEMDQSEMIIKLKQTGSPAQTKKPGQAGKGRPLNSKDSSKRKQKTVTPRTSAELIEEIEQIEANSFDFMNTLLWAKAAYNKISEIIMPGILEHFGKPNVRSLSADEFKLAEDTKFAVLCQMNPFGVINIEEVRGKLSHSLPSNFKILSDKLLKSMSAAQTLTIDDKRQVKCMVYSILYSE